MQRIPLLEPPLPPPSSALDEPGPRTASQPSQEVHLRTVLEGLPVGVVTFNGHHRILLGNNRLANMLGIERAALEDAGLREMLEASPVLRGAAAETVYAAAAAAVACGEERQARIKLPSSMGGRVFALRVAPLLDGTWMASLLEVTEQHAAEEAAVELAMHDALTGLPNREVFMRRVAAALAERGDEERHGLLLIDLDRFKAINDTLGHPVGDGLLRLVAKRLRTVIRQGDTISRLGGDEFALLAAHAAEVGQYGQLARRLVDVLSRPYLVDGHLLNVGASVGIAVSPTDGDGPDALLRSADLALYASKKAGRGTYTFFEPAMDARALARRTLEIDLRKALALGEFELHYQPQVDLELARVVGFEALVRWRHPTRGLVSPGEFIPLAEEIGLIVPLGEWVLREACKQAAGWPVGVSVAVNVSSHQFENPGRLTMTIAQALTNAGLPGARLEVEVTESVLLRNEAGVLAALHEIRALGARVAMDDFGTGYSSLSQLHSFPFDKIKIDRSFVTDNADAASASAIVRAITSLGVSLGISTIAEGVETSDQLARIRAEGCNSVQGYLFSRPVPAERVDALIVELGAQPPPQLAT